MITIEKVSEVYGASNKNSKDCKDGRIIFKQKSKDLGFDDMLQERLKSLTIDAELSNKVMNGGR